MKREIFTTALFSFVLVLLFILLIKPFSTDTLSTQGLIAYALAAATASTVAVCLSLFVTWRLMKFSVARYGYWGRMIVGLLIVPQLIVIVSVLNMVAFDCTTYQILDRMLPITRNILVITVVVFVFDYFLYRTFLNKRRDVSLADVERNIKEQQEGLVLSGRVYLSETVSAEAKNLIYCVYDGYYTKVYYIDDKGAVKTRDIPISLEAFVKKYQSDIPTLIQCHTKYALNTMYLEHILRNWFGKLSLKLRIVKVSIPCSLKMLLEEHK